MFPNGEKELVETGHFQVSLRRFQKTPADLYPLPWPDSQYFSPFPSKERLHVCIKIVLDRLYLSAYLDRNRDAGGSRNFWS